MIDQEDVSRVSVGDSEDLSQGSVIERVDLVGTGGFLLVYGYLLWGIELGNLYAFGDFPPYYGMQAIGKFGGTWHEVQLGYSYIYNVLPAYLGGITLVGGAVAQNLFFLSLLPLGFVSFLVFGRRFIDRPSALYLGSGLYALNPVTISEFVNGGVAALIGFAGFPLVVHCLYRIHERDSWTGALKTGILFGATNVSVWLTFWMYLPFALYFGAKHRTRPRRLSKFAGAALLGVLLSLPNFHHVLQRAGQFDDGRSVLVDSLLWNYAEADVLSVLRLAGNHGTLAMNELGYNSGPMMTIGLVIPCIAAVSVHRTELRLYHGVVVLATGFLVLTEMGVTFPLFDVLPPLWSLRNPVKLQYPLLLSMSLAFGCGVQTVLDSRVDPRNVSRADVGTVAILGILVLSLFTYVHPAQGAVGLDQTRGNDYFVSGDERDVVEQLDGRVLWVPYGYVTQLHLRNVHPDHVGIKSGGVLHGIQNTEYVASLFEDFASGTPVSTRLETLGVRHVVVSKDPPEQYGNGDPRLVRKFGAPWLWGDPSSYRELLATSPNYELAAEDDDYAVYRVAGSGPVEDTETRTGLHTVVYPETPDVEAIGENMVENPSFVNGTTGWWTPPETEGRTVTHEEGRVTLVTESGTEKLPIAQEVEVRPQHPYRLHVDGTGEGKLLLFWYTESKSPENRVTVRSVPLNETPVEFTAKADLLSVRIKPTERELVVRDVELSRTTYPPQTGTAENAENIPGVVVDEPLPQSTTVASNLPRRAAQVHVTDAETVLEGELVFDEKFRQGVAVDPNGSATREIPPDADVVTYENGTVIDYWVRGEFDDTEVTIRRTSYDERWSGPPGSTHFRAFGWANGFTNASPSEIDPPDNGTRSAVVGGWLLGWLLSLTALLGVGVSSVVDSNNL